MTRKFPSHKSFDTAIIGAGVVGLWAARHAIKRGERVILVEKRKIGSGASGGFLGALMPHMPDVWNAKKQFQLDGLTTLGEAVDALQADTGLDCGYRQCGRIMPVLHEKLLPQIERRISGAAEHWGNGYSLQNLATPQMPNQWLSRDIATHGAQTDSLSARINPRAYVRALEVVCRSRAEICEDMAVVGIGSDDTGGTVTLADGHQLSVGKVIVAAGWEAYALLQPHLETINAGKPIGRGVKGQAVLLDYAHADDLPIVYHDGAYVVPHGGNRVAIGSTSINDWQSETCHQPETFDYHDMDFYRRAMDLVPALKKAPIIERWAGVRPRNTLAGRGTSPWFGPVPAQPNLVALIGGFKITLGVAHLDFASNPFTI